jgi:hypothetical protein
MLDEKAVEQTQFFTSDSRPYGLTCGQWTVMWWQWFLSTPKAVNPVLDESGKFASVNQPHKDVWFLAGKIGNEDKNIPSRFCRIPSGRSILFPVINCEANPLEFPELTTEQDLIEHVNRDENTIITKVCSVNGRRIPVQRIKSDPSVFEVRINEDNVCDLKGGGITLASGDGYWVFLKPLPLGDHFISFRGSCEKGKLNSGANYRLKVQEATSISEIEKQSYR